MTKQKYSLPESTKDDATHASSRASCRQFHFLGGVAAEVFQFVVQPPLEERRSDWMRQVGEDLQQLQEQGLTLDNLQSNEKFISAVMHASQIAIRTHHEEKIQALATLFRTWRWVPLRMKPGCICFSSSSTR
jgi:hypothetical protein